MPYIFKILSEKEIDKVIPLVEKLDDYKISQSVLKERFLEMVTQNYECAVIVDEDEIIGVCGLWYCTRHYSGRSVELDHVYVEKKYRGSGLGSDFFKWITNYLKEKGLEAIELNTYVSNHKSHKFYYSLDFKILGFHFLKTL